jgi:hypothetical protein
MSRPQATSSPTRITAARNDRGSLVDGRKNHALTRTQPCADPLGPVARRTQTHPLGQDGTARHRWHSTRRQLPRTNRAAAEADTRIRRRPRGATGGMGCCQAAARTAAYTRVSGQARSPVHPYLAPTRPVHADTMSTCHRGARGLLPSFIPPRPPTILPRGSAVQAPHTEPQSLDRRSLDHRCARSRGQALRGYSPAVWAARCQESRPGLFVLAWWGGGRVR